MRRKPGKSINPLYLVRGTLRCGFCGALMTSASSFRRGRLYRYYRCITKDKAGARGCPTTQLPAEALEQFVAERIQEVFRDPSLGPSLQAHLQGLGLQAPGEAMEQLWGALTLENRQRLVRVLVEEVRVDEHQQRLSVRFRDLENLCTEESLC